MFLLQYNSVDDPNYKQLLLWAMGIFKVSKDKNLDPKGGCIEDSSFCFFFVQVNSVYDYSVGCI